MNKPEFFPSSGPILLAAIAEYIGAEIAEGGKPELKIISTAPIESASEGAITFLDNTKYASFLKTTNASAVICKAKFRAEVPDHISVLVHEKPYEAYAQALVMLFPSSLRPQSITGETGVSSAAYLSEGVTLEENVTVEAGVVLGKNCSIGNGSQILAGTVIGANVQIGRNSSIGPRANISCAMIGDNVIIHSGVSIGEDGFGYSMSAQGHSKIPQIGRVIIQNDVEIGANTAIDRGANRDTIIGEGTKIDNLVQIGHNAVIGRHCIIVGMVGISGSATLGDFVVVAGHSGIAGHLTVGDGVQIGGGSGVYNSIEAGQKVMGNPAIPARMWMRNAAKIMRDAKIKPKKGN